VYIYIIISFIYIYIYMYVVTYSYVYIQYTKTKNVRPESRPTFWDIKKLRTSTIDAAQENMGKHQKSHSLSSFPLFELALFFWVNPRFQVAARTGAPAITSLVSGMTADPSDPHRTPPEKLKMTNSMGPLGP
jgi:hypothetical protein